MEGARCDDAPPAADEEACTNFGGVWGECVAGCINPQDNSCFNQKEDGTPIDQALCESGVGTGMPLEWGCAMPCTRATLAECNGPPPLCEVTMAGSAYCTGMLPDGSGGMVTLDQASCEANTG